MSTEVVPTEKCSKALQALLVEGFVVHRVLPGPIGHLSKQKIDWTCPKGHRCRKPVLFQDMARGTRCQRCNRAGRQPRAPIVLLPGTRNGDLEVIKNLGVIDGFSRVLVKNITNDIVRTIISSDFLSGKRKLLDAQQIRSLCRENGNKSLGRLNPNNSIFSWQNVLDSSRELGFTLLHPMIDGPVFNSGTRYVWQFKCKCGNIFSPTIYNVVSKTIKSCGCVKSQPQIDINDYLKSFGLETFWNTRRVVSPLELDIWIPSKKVAVEYCGLFWHSERILGVEARNKHAAKLVACEKAGIRLVTIFEDEWLRRPNVVKSYLGSILGLPSVRVGARKCSIKQLDTERSMARAFFGANHLQGPSNGLTWGLFYKDELLAAACFAKCNASRARKSTNTEYELARYCIAPGYSVPGGLERLIKAFCLATPQATTLISYSDNRWSAGAIYRRLGFTRVSNNRPSYWYFPERSQTERYHRYRYRRSEAVRIFGGTPEETEWDIMSRSGYDRIWDCGTKTWSLNLNNNFQEE